MIELKSNNNTYFDVITLFWRNRIICFFLIKINRQIMYIVKSCYRGSFCILQSVFLWQFYLLLFLRCCNLKSLLSKCPKTSPRLTRRPRKLSRSRPQRMCSTTFCHQLINLKTKMSWKPFERWMNSVETKQALFAWRVRLLTKFEIRFETLSMGETIGRIGKTINVVQLLKANNRYLIPPFCFNKNRTE